MEIIYVQFSYMFRLDLLEDVTENMVFEVESQGENDSVAHSLGDSTRHKGHLG